MNVYIENLMESTLKKRLELSSAISEYKINIQKSDVFIHSNNEQLEIENFKNHFKMVKNMQNMNYEKYKIIKNKSDKRCEDLYNEN